MGPKAACITVVLFMGAVEKSGSGILNRLGFSDGGYVEAKEERVAIIEFGFDGMDEGLSSGWH